MPAPPETGAWVRGWEDARLLLICNGSARLWASMAVCHRQWAGAAAASPVFFRSRRRILEAASARPEQVGGPDGPWEGDRQPPEASSEGVAPPRGPSCTPRGLFRAGATLRTRSAHRM